MNKEINLFRDQIKDIYDYGTCVETCPKGTLKGDKKCEECMANCNRCEEKDKCLECGFGYYKR